MRAKTILAMILGVFVIVALVTIAKQAIHSAPRNDKPIAASAMEHPNRTGATPEAGNVQSRAFSPPQRGEGGPFDSRFALAQGKLRPDEGSLTERQTPHSRVADPLPVAALKAVERPQHAVPPAHVRKVVATYFHGNIRCVTCRKIEAYSQEAVRDAFEQQIAAGTVEFRAVNVEEDANRHFIQDYQLVTRTLVVTDEVDGAVKRWAKLDNVWGLVGDRTAFFRYVQGGVRDYLETQ